MLQTHACQSDLSWHWIHSRNPVASLRPCNGRAREYIRLSHSAIQIKNCVHQRKTQYCSQGESEWCTARFHYQGPPLQNRSVNGFITFSRSVRTAVFFLSKRSRQLDSPTSKHGDCLLYRERQRHQPWCLFRVSRHPHGASTFEKLKGVGASVQE